MEQQTAIDLRDSLTSMEVARKELEAAPDAGVVAAAEDYQRAREAASPAFVAAQREWDLANAAGPAAAPDAPTEPRDREAAPGVPLVTPPGYVVTPASLADFGALAWYIPVGGDAEAAVPVQATPYAFDAGTAVQTPNGEVATAQPSRIVVIGDELGVVPQDQFSVVYANCPPDRIPSDTPPPPSSVPETPVEGAGEPPASVAGGTDLGAVPAPQASAESGDQGQVTS